MQLFEVFLIIREHGRLFYVAIESRHWYQALSEEFEEEDVGHDAEIKICRRGRPDPVESDV